MRNLIYFLLIILAGVFVLTSCFHKSDTTGTADDIKHSFTCHTSGGDYLITHDEIFHATSKSSGPRGTYITGYTDYRYTVRNMQTGAVVTRLVTGDRTEDFLPLGYDGKQLWCYGVEKNIGLHAREPVSMKVSIPREELEKENPLLAGNLSIPKFNEAGQFYSYDPVSNAITLTDIRGNLFSLDPQTLKARAIKKKPVFSNPFSDASSANAYKITGGHISLTGELRKQIDLGRDNKSVESYLKGEILLEQNMDHLSAIAAHQIKGNRLFYQKIQQEHDSLLIQYPVLKDQHQAYLSIRDNNILNRFYNLQSKLKDKKSDSAYKTDDNTRNLTKMVLSSDTNTIYILHANDLSDTSSILISKVSISDTNTILQWTTMVPQIYFDPSKGIKSNRMAEVFKSGNPQFRYDWYGIEGNVLVAIKMLFAFGIDITTGKLLWKIQL